MVKMMIALKTMIACNLMNATSPLQQAGAGPDPARRGISTANLFICLTYSDYTKSRQRLLSAAGRGSFYRAGKFYTAGLSEFGGWAGLPLHDSAVESPPATNEVEGVRGLGPAATIRRSAAA
jgi:hypothetical protein